MGYLEKVNTFVECELLNILDVYSSLAIKPKKLDLKNKLDSNSQELSDFAAYKNDEDDLWTQNIPPVSVWKSYCEVPNDKRCSSLEMAGCFLKLFQGNKNEGCRLFVLYVFMFDGCGDTHLLYKARSHYQRFFEIKNPVEHIVNNYFLLVRDKYYSNVSQEGFKVFLKELANAFLSEMKKSISGYQDILKKIDNLVFGSYPLIDEIELHDNHAEIFSVTTLVL